MIPAEHYCHHIQFSTKQVSRLPQTLQILFSILLINNVGKVLTLLSICTKKVYTSDHLETVL